MTHSPKPWNKLQEIDKGGVPNTLIVDKDGECVAQYMLEHDANLLLVAPEMLETLKKAALAIKSTPGADDQWHSLWYRMIKLINKAEGNQ